MMTDSKGPGETVSNSGKTPGWASDQRWRDAVPADAVANTIRVREFDSRVVFQFHPKIGRRGTLWMLGVWVFVIMLCLIMVPVFTGQGEEAKHWSSAAGITALVVMGLPGLIGLLVLIAVQYTRESIVVHEDEVLIDQNGRRVVVKHPDLQAVRTVLRAERSLFLNPSVFSWCPWLKGETGAIDLITVDGALRVLRNWKMHDLRWIVEALVGLTGVEHGGELALTGALHASEGDGRPVLIAPCTSNNDRGSLAWLMLGFGVLITCFFIWSAPLGLSTYGWRQTTGEVLRVAMEPNGKGTQRDPTIQYRYQIDGQYLTNDRFWYAMRNDTGRIKQIVNDYPKGSAITVYYDPSRPSRSVLIKGIDPYLYVLMPFPLALWVMAWRLWVSRVPSESAVLCDKYVLTHQARR